MITTPTQTPLHSKAISPKPALHSHKRFVLEQSQATLQLILLFFMIATTSSAVLGLGFWAVTGQTAGLLAGLIACVVGVVYTSAYFIARSGSSKLKSFKKEITQSQSRLGPEDQPWVTWSHQQENDLIRVESVAFRRFQIASYMLLVNLLLALSLGELVLGTGGVLTASFILIPILAGILRLRSGEVLATIILALISLTVFYTLEKIAGLYKPVLNLSEVPWIDLPFWLLTFGLMGSCVLIFIRRSYKSQLELSEQREELAEALSQLQDTFGALSIISQEVASATTELTANAEQQASGVQEQVAAVNQVTSSMEELSETANQIAGSARNAAGSAQQTVSIINEAKEERTTSINVAEQGQQAVEDTIRSVGVLRNRIELLGQRLLNLTEQNRRVTSIIDIIDEIADETHLLALNASIEAAGNVGEGIDSENSNSSYSDSRRLRGERFGVIALEIKGLADRSRESTEEVRQAITEMQGAVAAAVLVAEEGKKSTVDAQTRAQIAGAVIGKLNDILEASSTRFEDIFRAALEVQQRSEEINLATSQQRSANEQILQTMRNISLVAQQTAMAVRQISETILRINQRTADLNSGLGLAGANDKGNNFNSRSNSSNNTPPPPHSPSLGVVAASPSPFFITNNGVGETEFGGVGAN